MRILLDTHVLLWSLLESGRLPGRLRAHLEDPQNAVACSAATAWEVAIKQSLGKLTLPGPAARWLPTQVDRAGFEWLDVTPEVALAVGELPWHHRDPFDRLLVAQARAGWTLATVDERFGAYGIPLLWE